MTHPQASSLAAAGLSATRLRHDGSDLERGPALPTADAFSAIVQLKDFAAHKLWRGRRLVHDGGHAAGALAITYSGEEWCCHHLSPFDNVRFHLPRAMLDGLAREQGRPPPDRLDCPRGIHDPVLAALAAALVPALERPGEAHPLFVEHVLTAAATHILQTYGGPPAPTLARQGGLSRRQEALAKEFLSAHSGQDVSISQAAEACGLSRGHFIKGFRETTGRTPYQWLLQQRVARAQVLLLGDLPIVEVAAKCGFADQSHMTRIFRATTGMPPGAWRRARRG